MSDSEQCSNRLELDLISLLINFSCELGQIMIRYDFLWVRWVILSNVRTDWTWPNFTFGQLFMWIGANIEMRAIVVLNFEFINCGWCQLAVTKCRLIVSIIRLAVMKYRLIVVTTCRLVVAIRRLALTISRLVVTTCRLLVTTYGLVVTTMACAIRIYCDNKSTCCKRQVDLLWRNVDLL